MTTKNRVLAAIGAIALSTGLVSPALGSDNGTVSAQAVTSSATKALDWLETQFAANGHHLKSGFTDQNNQFQTFDDQGLTIDGLLALAAAGRAADAEAVEGANWMKGQVDEYVTGFDPNSLYAGALGKAMVFAETYKIDYKSVDGHNLENDLRGRLQPSGRFTDKASDFQTGDPVDFSNGVGQAFDVLALSVTTGGTPQSAVSYLLKQQCPNGGFRVQMADTQCADNTKADVDATSFALAALGALKQDALGNGIAAGVTRLGAEQKANGSLADNANSSGLAAATMRAFGGHPRANNAATFVKTLQLTSGADAGAILLDKEGYDAAANGLNQQTRTNAARSTAQAVLALGLPAYPLIGEREPVEPSTTIALSSSSVNERGTLTITGNGFLSTEKVKIVVTSDPVTVGEPVANASGIVSQSVTLPAAVTPGSHTVTLTGQTSAVTISAPFTVVAQTTATTATTAAPRGATTTTVASAIVRTGPGSADGQAIVATALVCMGGALMLTARRRRIVYPFKK